MTRTLELHSYRERHFRSRLIRVHRCAWSIFRPPSLAGKPVARTSQVLLERNGEGLEVAQDGLVRIDVAVHVGERRAQGGPAPVEDLTPKDAPLPESLVRLVGPEAEQDGEDAAEQRVRQRGQGGQLRVVDVYEGDEQRPRHRREELEPDGFQHAVLAPEERGQPVLARVALRRVEDARALVREPGESRLHGRLEVSQYRLLYWLLRGAQAW